MNIEPETPVYKQIEGFIRTACEREWDNPITKIVKYKRYYEWKKIWILSQF